MRNRSGSRCAGARAARTICAAVLAVAATSAGCEARSALDRDALMDPGTCASCHPAEYRDWSGSMHAYASDDPVLFALDALGQRETDGALGSLCIGCHAPMAFATGAAAVAADVVDAPRALRGVTCYFCHQVDRVDGDHNGQLHLADDGVFRGGIADPVDTPAHGSAYSPLHDGDRLESSALCGSCHDVVSPAGVHIERTYAEWRESVFATSGPLGVSCSGCHMPGRSGPGADLPGAPQRRTHDHRMPGVDMALGPWPETEAQRQGIERDLGASLAAKLCVQPPGTEVEVTLDNVLVGHAWPSGVTHARRGWVELIAYAGGVPIFSSGDVADGQPVESLDDPQLWQMRSRLYDGDGNEVHTAWKAATVDADDLLPPAVTSDPTDPRFYHAVTRRYTLPGVPDRVTMRVRLRPVGLDLLPPLVDAGLLDPSVADALPTFTLASTELEWTADAGIGACVQ
ncbi:MAG: hypothetical protein D6689_19020 [Deltaproteobacteria bacterium]|nr:MAG: hypothetical protein D6689_19020 [Deltaproteobacteria bacterium]